MTPRILVTGAAGFVGRAAVPALLRHVDGGALRLLVHRTPPIAPAAAERVAADLTRPASLAAAVAGIDTVLHLGVAVGADESTADLVNRRGTQALVEAAQRAGVRRIVQLGTAAVYGDGPQRGAPEEAVTPAPVSPTSRSRLAAEHLVRAAGGVVLRAPFILGAGDIWFLPTLLRVLDRLGSWVDGGRALLSVATVEQVGAVLAAAATAGHGLRPGAVYHANHPDPVRVRDLVTAAGRLGFPVPTADVPLAQARRRLPAGVTERHLTMFFVDHWYDSGRLWRELGTAPGPAPLAAFGAYTGWYGSHLAGQPWWPVPSGIPR